MTLSPTELAHAMRPLALPAVALPSFAALAAHDSRDAFAAPSGDVAEQVRDLVSVVIDSARGLDAAARLCADGDVSALFADLAGQRRAFAEQLQTRLAAGSADPRAGGTLTGLMHRWWMTLHELVAGDTRLAVLTDAASGEDEVLGAYEAAAGAMTGRRDPLRDLVARQHEQVRAAHARVSALRDAARIARAARN